ncbi:ATP-dependent Clp protease ATP-binding subunit [Paraburkholderia dilworthii]|uniref:ATP-dependent Clp protease ATP-binding subunit n=1 Tax=Paraburkholderia dilworthii TaxID=948106 RepID=UPI000403F4EB|nr:ATP-dependent Clp protease ATP-binding subunit [Paraburkholderia dilworthii]
MIWLSVERQKGKRWNASRENIRSIVQIQLERVTRTAATQDITLKVQDSVIDHLADVGYRPEFGARQLKRQIRQELETPLAKEILGDKVKPGDTVDLSYDKETDKVTFAKLEVEAKQKKARSSSKKSAAKSAGSTKESAESKS